MKNYIEINRKAYNELASEYKERFIKDSEKDRKILLPVVEYLKSTFKEPIRVLDIGAGNGLNLDIMTENGIVGVGVEIADKMLIIARQFCPNAILIEEDFLETKLYRESFEAILAKASLHLFPKDDAIKVLEKSFELLVPDGLLFIATTISEQSKEGYFSKPGYQNKSKRYRKYWTRDELNKTVVNVGFLILKETYNYEQDWKKQWINIFAIKPNVSKLP